MPKLTREQAIEEHRKMWNWIADEIEKSEGSKSLRGLFYIKRKYLHQFEGTDFYDIYYDCFLCEYCEYTLYPNNSPSKYTDIKCDDGKLCPLKWKNGCCITSEYAYFHNLFDKLLELNEPLSITLIRKKEKITHKCVELARKIANLPEKDCSQ